MKAGGFTESIVENAALARLEVLGCVLLHFPGMPSGGRRNTEAAG